MLIGTRVDSFSRMDSLHAAHVTARFASDPNFVRNSLSMFNRSTSDNFCMSAGIAMQDPGPTAVNSFAVASQSFAEREEM